VSDLLAEMAQSSRERAGRIHEDAFRHLLEAAPRVRPLDATGFVLIAEVKFRAPSAGQLATSSDPSGDAARRAHTYAKSGADAVSVLTEPDRFDGDLAYLEAAAEQACCMRKDFLVDPKQVWEARAHGASGVLLIVRMLDDDALHAMLRAAATAGMFVLLEAFDADDLARCHVDWDGDQPLMVGVNCRDLRTLEVDPDRFETLAPHLPRERVAIAESGMQTPEDIRRVVEFGYRGALVGSTLMRAPDPGALVRAMKRAGGES
jgi:indole-3-glycerol phosphate synthase